ncbi:MAG: hypothetical protein HUK03_05690 [Bacteroidaceae bacterium]|nr:hypothetical protein [Bacteroidaceae bacterium]
MKQSYFLKSVLALAVMLFAFAPRTRAEETPDYTIEYKFEVENMAAGLCLSMTDDSHFYMWQFNTEQGNMRFRPHRWNGGAACLEEKTLDGVSMTGEHSVRIEITNNGTTATTYVDGNKIDERTGEFVYGRLGSRANGQEKAYFDDIVVTKNGVQEVNENFNNGENSLFDGGEVINGRWHHTSSPKELVWQFPLSEYGTYTIEADFKVVDNAAGLAFARDNSNYFMWQFNKENQFNPHVWDPNARLIETIELTEKGVDVRTEGMHHLKIDVTNGARKAITYVDDVKVDERTGSFVYGQVGLRHDALPDNTPESGLWDNIKVTAGGTVKFQETFDNPYASKFSLGTWQDGCWFISGYLLAPIVWYSETIQPATIFECDATPQKGGFGLMQGWVSDNEFQLWALVEKNGRPALRRHAWRDGGWKYHNAGSERAMNLAGGSPLGRTQRIRLVKQGNTLSYYDNGYLIDSYDQKASNDVDVKDAYFGFRMDEGDNAYMDNMKMVTVAEGGAYKVVMDEDFENGFTAFTDCEIRDFNGSKQLFIASPGGEVKFHENSLYSTVTAANKWATYAPNHPVVVPESLDELRVLVVTDINRAKNTMTVTDVDAGTTIAAGTGVLLYAKEGTDLVWNYSENTPATLTNLLTGVTATTATEKVKTDPSNTLFAMGNRGYGAAFYPYTGTIVAPNKAYLQLANASSIGEMTIDDGETAIEMLEAVGKGLQDGDIYDVAGHKLSSIQGKGLYIVGGKKLLVK